MTYQTLELSCEEVEIIANCLLNNSNDFDDLLAKLNLSENFQQFQILIR
jgi:hypothetical protein